MNFEVLNITAIIASIVSEMKAETTVTMVATAIAGGYLITVSDSSKLNNLQNGMIIEINNNAYEVSNLQKSTFDIITTNNLLSFTDWSILLELEKGHHKEVNNEFINKEQNNDTRFKVTPMLWLKYDNEQSKAPLNSVYWYDVPSIKLAFIAASEKHYTSDERDENVILPILVPLYSLFVKYLLDSELFYLIADEVPNISEHKRYRYGSQNNDADMFADTTDAFEAEITGAKISFRAQNIINCN